MADSYKVNDKFNLISFSRALSDHLDSKYFYSAEIKQSSQFMCRIDIRKGAHQGNVRLVLVSKSLQVFVSESIESAAKNIGAVVVATVTGLLLGKDKGIGKSVLFTAGGKALENMDFKNNIKKNINSFVKNYLNY